MRPYRRLIRGLFVLAFAAGASACVSYPAYEPAPATVYYVDEPWGCDPFYGPCAPGYGYSSGYWYGGYYGYPHYYYGHPYYYGRPPHDHRGDGDNDDRADWIRNWPPRDRPADPPRDRPGTRPGNKPGVVYAPKPPRLVPDDRKIPRDPGPSVQRDAPGRVVPARKPDTVRDSPQDSPRVERIVPRVERGSVKPPAPEAAPPAPAAKESSPPSRKQPGRTRDTRQND